MYGKQVQSLSVKKRLFFIVHVYICFAILLILGLGPYRVNLLCTFSAKHVDRERRRLKDRDRNKERDRNEKRRSEWDEHKDKKERLNREEEYEKRMKEKFAEEKRASSKDKRRKDDTREEKRPKAEHKQEKVDREHRFKADHRDDRERHSKNRFLVIYSS